MAGGLEYAASAMNLAKGRGAVLHFGGYTYPSRYTGGYPLILESFTAWWRGFPPLFASMILGMLSYSGFHAHRGISGAAATVAALLLGFRPSSSRIRRW